MGYTHYIRQKSSFTTEQWAQFCETVRKIFAESPCALSNWAGVRGEKPQITKNFVSFNGVEGDSHDTCRINIEATDFNFCKTVHKPYDPVVVAVYKAVRDILPDTELSSDGGDEVFDAS